jgi:hypothetical protein
VAFRAPAILLLCSLTAWAASSCAQDGRACYPADYERCTCDDGEDGYRRCDDAGDGYGTCDCSGTIPGLTTGAGSGGNGAGGGGSGGDGAGGAAKLPFMSPCATDDECETGLCHPFNAKGTLCSKPCSIDSDCPPPSPGCNMMGVCKAP